MFDLKSFDKLQDKFLKADILIDKLILSKQNSISEMAKALGFEKIKMEMEEEYDSGRTYKTIRIAGMFVDGKDIVDGYLDSGYVNNELREAFEAIEALEVPNSVDFITDGKVNKFDLLDQDEIDGIEYGKLAYHFLKQGVKQEVALSFMDKLCLSQDSTPEEWW